MARKGILTTDIPAARAAKDAPRPAPRGAVGALQSSLSKLQENAVQEIDAGLIDDAGFEDRLGHDSTANAQLRDSLRTYGQQVPVLLRPHPAKPGRYEIVYGRRRLKALKDLGLPVKAMIRQLDDHALVMAQGQENTSRQDLSFIEKAAFAKQLDAAGYERQTIADALSTDLPMLSRMLKVGAVFDMDMLRAVGSAPDIGRDRWLHLVKLMEDPAAAGRVRSFVNRPEFLDRDSNARFETLIKRAKGERVLHRLDPPEPKPQVAKARTLRAPDGAALADIRKTAKGVTLSVPAKTAEAFGTWLEANAEALIADLHDRWQKDRSED